MDHARGIRRLVPAGPARAHMGRFLDDRFLPTAISDASGVPLSTVQNLLEGLSARINRRTEAAILAVTHEALIESATGYIPNVGARRRLHALMANGWTQPTLTSLIGVDVNGVMNTRHLMVAKTTHDAIRRVYHDLADTPGPSVIGRAKAVKRGHQPPEAWDDETGPHCIDDPAARPRPSSVDDIDEAVWSIRAGRASVADAAAALGVRPDSFVTSLRRRAARTGRPEDHADHQYVLRARAEETERARANRTSRRAS